MIRFKLTRKDRTSCLIHPKSQFCKRYLKDTVVKADPQTPGIFLYKTRRQAKDYKRYWQRDWLILRVETIGPGAVPKKVSRLITQRSIISFSKKFASMCSMVPPGGTICYPAVRVLD